MSDEATATSAAPGSGTLPGLSARVEEAMDKVWANEPEPEPKAESEAKEPAGEPAETEQPDPDAVTKKEPTGDAETQPEPEATTEPHAETQGHPLTPEEEFLLKRQRLSEDEIAFYGTLTVDQRNVLLKPLRAAQHKLDTIFGMTKEAREAAISQEQQRGTAPPEQPDAVANAIRQRLAPDQKALDEFATKNSLDADSVRNLAAALNEKHAAYIAELEKERETLRQSGIASQVDSASAEARSVLAKDFPKIATDSEFAAITNDPETVSLFEAKLRKGLPVAQAMKEAFRQQATLRYLSEVTQKRQAAVKSDRDKALKNTPEPTRNSLSRGAGQAVSRPKNVDEAIAMVEAEMRGD